MSDNIQIRGLSKTFTSTRGEDKQAIADVDLEVEPGTFVSIVGPSGCGKTTLLMIVAGLESYRQGEVLIDGESVTGPRSNVGIVYQRPVLLPWQSAIENTLLPVKLRGLPLKDYRTQAESLLTQVGLGAFMNHYPTELSGGMAQRNALARALILNPGLLLMDEPFAALDALTREQMAILLAQVWETNRTTVLFVTHSIPEAIILADRVVVMSQSPGRIVADIPVGIPRPRRFNMVDEPDFVTLARRVRAELAPTLIGETA